MGSPHTFLLISRISWRDWFFDFDAPLWNTIFTSRHALSYCHRFWQNPKTAHPLLENRSIRPDQCHLIRRAKGDAGQLIFPVRHVASPVVSSGCDGSYRAPVGYRVCSSRPDSGAKYGPPPHWPACRSLLYRSVLRLESFFSASPKSSYIRACLRLAGSHRSVFAAPCSVVARARHKSGCERGLGSRVASRE